MEDQNWFHNDQSIGKEAINKGGLDLNFYSNYIETLTSILNKIEATEDNKIINCDTAIERWVDYTRELYKVGKVMYFIGNGASSMMAGHMSADANKNGRLKSMTFNEISILTAISNDISFDQVFAFQLEKFGTQDDILVTISSSGNSPNIIEAILTAKKLGILTITLSGMSTSNRSRHMGNLNFFFPAKTYGVVEVAHQALLHCWLDRYLDRFEGGSI